MTIGPIILDCASLADGDAAAVDCIARVCLAARERDTDIVIENASPRLRLLIDFCGLGDVLLVEVQRHPE